MRGHGKAVLQSPNALKALKSSFWYFISVTRKSEFGGMTMILRSMLHVISVGAVLWLTVPVGEASIIYNNGSPNQSDGANITGFVAGDDFTLGGSVTLTGGAFWSSANFDPFGNSFSGTIGWAILADSGGSPGTILASGSDSSPVLTDTGAKIFGTDEWQIDFSFGSISLNAGTYWLTLHEGALGTPDDGTTIYWDTTGNQTGSLSQTTADLTAASGWSSNGALVGGNGSDLAFQLSGGSGGGGSTVPEPSSVGLVGAGIVGILLLMKRKRVL
jgi:hypothetical protein